jgi:hypothetical protein
MKKESQILAKGHNKTLEIVIPMEYTRTATDDVYGHVSGNGGTCHVVDIFATIEAKASGC